MCVISSRPLVLMEQCEKLLLINSLFLCPAQFARVQERMSVQEELDKLMFLVSDQSLTLLPEYYQRIKVRYNHKYIFLSKHPFYSAFSDVLCSIE